MSDLRNLHIFYSVTFSLTKASWGEPGRAMMWDQRCDRIGDPAEVSFT